MSRLVKLTSAAIAIVLAAILAGVVAHDRDQSSPQSQTVRQLSVEAQPGHYRLQLAPRTVTNLGLHRNGCTLTQESPAVAVCDIPTAFPDVGLDGTVTFIGSGHDTDASLALVADIRN